MATMATLRLLQEQSIERGCFLQCLRGICKSKYWLSMHRLCTQNLVHAPIIGWAWAAWHSRQSPSNPTSCSHDKPRLPCVSCLVLTPPQIWWLRMRSNVFVLLHWLHASKLPCWAALTMVAVVVGAWQQAVRCSKAERAAQLEEQKQALMDHKREQ
eukprot:scaffold105135_cov18-Tisochrysis_lutea.AAC.1